VKDTTCTSTPKNVHLTQDVNTLYK